MHLSNYFAQIEEAFLHTKSVYSIISRGTKWKLGWQNLIKNTQTTQNTQQRIRWKQNPWEGAALCLINFHGTHTHTLSAQATKTPFYANFGGASESQSAKKNKNINDLPMYNPYKWHSTEWKMSSLSLMSVRFSSIAGYTDFSTQLPLSFGIWGFLNFLTGGNSDICERVKRLISIDNMCLRYIRVRLFLCLCVNIVYACMLI